MIVLAPVSHMRCDGKEATRPRYGLQGGGAMTMVSSSSALLLRLRYRKKAKAIRARTTRPPKIPPTIPPISTCVVPELGVGVTGIEEVDVVVWADEVDAAVVDVAEVVAVAVVKNTDALLGSLARTAPTRSSSGHTPSLSHGPDAQHPMNVGPFVHVYHDADFVDETQAWAGIWAYFFGSNFVGRTAEDGHPFLLPLHGSTAQHPRNLTSLS